MISTLLLSPVSIFMIITLNPLSGVLLISVSLKSLAVVFFLFFHLGPIPLSPHLI